jgi:hypothetical protein
MIQNSNGLMKILTPLAQIFESQSYHMKHVKLFCICWMLLCEEKCVDKYKQKEEMLCWDIIKALMLKETRALSHGLMVLELDWNENYHRKDSHC